MTTIVGIGWLSPWLLIALAALPILWLILRAIPPAPIRQRFPGVALLLGLQDDETVTDRTPWWLLLLRMLAVAGLILGLAGPVLNPDADGAQGDGPLVIALDASWAGAPLWGAISEAIEAELNRATVQDRPAAILSLTNPEAPVFLAANALVDRLPGIQPQPWQPVDVSAIRAALNESTGFDTIWFSDGIEYDARDDVLALLETQGAVSVIEGVANSIGLRPAKYVDGLIELNTVRSQADVAQDVNILAQGRDPSGNATSLARVTAQFEDGGQEASVELSLPSELRARITHFEIQGIRSAGSVALSDDALRRREIALIAGLESREGLELLSPLHYLERALEDNADLLTGGLSEILPANPDVIVLADVAKLADGESEQIAAWVEKGGMLLRFAGPRVAASDVSRDEEDPLMPVRLRSGGRSVGGAMSWGTPKTLAPFPEESPFYGLALPLDVEITAQVVAQPDPTLAERVIAALSDGTPLVTRKSIGQGQVVLFHVTANAEWSTLPLSGLFVRMLERLAIAAASGTPQAEDLAGSVWTPVRVLDGFGRLGDAGTRPGVDGADLIDAPTGPDLLPGLYQSGDRNIARNVLSPDTTLTPTTWPERIPVSGLTRANERPLGGYLLSLALVLLLADIVASLALSGRLFGRQNAVVGAVLAAVLLIPGTPSQAQDSDGDDFALNAVSELVLAYVETGNRQVDETSMAGLKGLTDVLFFRTSIEPAAPVGVNLETDELAFFPMLYWPITPDQPRPSLEAYARLNDYLRSGGMILFDTRDANVSGFGASTPNGKKLQQLAASLDVPALEPIPNDHVLTRTFYLLQDFPGRHLGRDVWVEAAPPDATQVEGVPFRNLNDGVTPVVIGGNDWAAAWAVTDAGSPMFPVGRGFGGERQRELAYRFGVNIVMHVLTGNYKSDQVHVPALLDRLSQ
ncbi:MAG: DUF4159 domain-containing protein [Paracoccaceae bacterium]